LGVPDIRLDPALLAASVYRDVIDRAAPRDRPVALGVTDEGALRLHADGSAVGVADPRTLWRALAEALRADGRDVVVFTNGAAEDDVLLRRAFPLQEPRAGARGGLAVAPRPIRPRDLVAQISGAALVIGHRLHAAIIAYALGVPSIGFSWNAKMQGFFALTGRSAFLVDPARTSPGSVAALAAAALDAGIDAALRRALIRQAEDDVGALARALAPAAAPVHASS
ncbi:MAG: polysaccharide pyruvyl transferase family protein, partial [Parvularculaceae bacterium]|nr:polysaccharide pyruvyl transferase family protein [Parvularculaceae bacterium]